MPAALPVRPSDPTPAVVQHRPFVAPDDLPEGDAQVENVVAEARQRWWQETTLDDALARGLGRHEIEGQADPVQAAGRTESPQPNRQTGPAHDPGQTFSGQPKGQAR